MSDRPIQVGDLVTVVKPRLCCGDASGVGLISKVLLLTKEPANCPRCGPDTIHLHAVLEVGWCEVLRLKRIPPLEELEGQRTQEDIKETA